jgi:hypothetical protein
VPVVLRLIAGSVLLLAGLTLLVVGVLGSRRRLPRNRWIGIRSRATLRSDAAFAHGNRVGAVPAGAAGAVAVLGGAALLAGGDGALDWVILVVALVGSFGLACVAGSVGDRAAVAVAVAPRPAACAGTCTGCDLVAGCRDEIAERSVESTTRPE